MSGHHTRLQWCRKQHCLNSKIDKNLKPWLFDSGSLTARLIKSCKGQFSVKVLSITRETPTPDEIEALNMRPRSQALIRQVLLYCDDTPVVYARTIIPASSLRGELRGLALLGNKPLGAVLFSDKSMQRKPMEITAVKPSHKCYGWLHNKDEKTVWGRRSVFRLKGKQLLVSEYFLSALLSD